MSKFLRCLVSGATSAAIGLGITLANAAGPDSILQDHRIGYVVTAQHWSTYQSASPDVDCPQGLNTYGPREIFKALFPNGGTVEATSLAREGLKVFPGDRKANFPFVLYSGAVAKGMNLDGKVGPNDFVSPSGEKGIKNNLSRVTNCHQAFRPPNGQLQLFASTFIAEFGFDRMMIEIDNVEDLIDSAAVDVTIYRGRDRLLLDATGEKVAPGGTQRIDMRYGKPLIQHLRGRVTNGVLTTDPIPEGIWAWAIWPLTPRVLRIRDMRLSLRLTPDTADGLLAGYTDIHSFYRWMTSWSSHHLSYDHNDPSEFYWALRENADAYPDESGAMTAISSAISVNMTRVFIVHADEGTQVLPLHERGSQRGR
jgi:hypothetical protein